MAGALTFQKFCECKITPWERADHVDLAFPKAPQPNFIIRWTGGVGMQTRRLSKVTKARRADYMAAILTTLKVSQFLTTLPITEAYYGIPNWLIFHLLWVMIDLEAETSLCMICAFSYSSLRLPSAISILWWHAHILSSRFGHGYNERLRSSNR